MNQPQIIRMEEPEVGGDTAKKRPQFGGGVGPGVQAYDWLEESDEPVGLELFIVSSKGYRMWTSSVKQIIKT